MAAPEGTLANSDVSKANSVNSARQASNRQSDVQATPRSTIGMSDLLIDPRQWTRDHVIAWLLWATDHYGLEAVDVERFNMNGHGLIYLTKEGFIRRAPSSGEKLFEDFRKRFAYAIMQDNRNRQHKV
ncbi:uncharacterized protein LOC144364023 [Saccoglossus kowalevskii]